MLRRRRRSQSGEKPKADSQVKIFYEGKLIDGTVFGDVPEPQKKPEKKKELLLKAIGALNVCSDEYPEYEKIKTVTDNTIFLKTELDR